MDQEVAKTLGELELKLQELERELTSIGRSDAQPKPGQAPGKLIDEAVEHDTTDDGSSSGDTGAAGSAEVGLGNTDFANDEDERAVDNAFGGPAIFGGEEIPAQAGTIEGGTAFPVSETAYGEITTGSPSPTSSFPSGVFSPTPPGISQPGPPLPPPMAQQQTPYPQQAQHPQHPQAPQYQQHQQYTQHPQQGQPSLSTAGVPPGPTPPPGPLTPPGPPPPTTPPSPPSVPPTPTPQPPPPAQPIDRAELVRFKEKMQRTMEDLIDEYGRLLLPKPPA